MSSVDNAKRQAKRLLKYAKDPRKNNSSAIAVPTLNNSLEVISIINGYQNWYDYRLNLEKEDLSLNKKDKNKINNEKKSLLENKDYLLQEIPVELYDYVKKPAIKKVVKEHIPIVAGYEKQQSNTFSFKKQPKKEWILKEYPVTLAGCCGAGRSESLTSFIHEYIKNKEGFIFITNDNSVYAHVFGFVKKFNRLEEFYTIYLDAKNISKETYPNKTYTHTFDPINPMVDSPDYFINLFGKEMGVVIQALIKHYHVKKKIVSINTIESFLNIKTLIKLGNELNIEELNNYLSKIEYTSEINEKIIRNHINISCKAYKTMDLLKSYECLFSHEPVVDFEDIFLNRKLLQIQCSLTYADKNEFDMVSIICQNILHADKKIKDKHHYQNIIFNDFDLYLNNESDEKNMIDVLLTTQNNYILAANSASNNDIIERLGKISPTFICMKGWGYKLPDYLKLKAINNMKNVPPLFFYNQKGIESQDKKWKNVQDLHEGEMYVFVENKLETYQYTEKKKRDFNILFVDSIYVYPETVEKIYLYPHE